jgi:hypothetical protein
MSMMGRIAILGETIYFGGYWRCEVVEMDILRVNKMLISFAKKPTPEKLANVPIE